MARPISSKMPKVHLNLSVTEQTKAELTYLANLNHTSISEMVANWASEDIATARRKGILKYNHPGQLSIFSR